MRCACLKEKEPFIHIYFYLMKKYNELLEPWRCHCYSRRWFSVLSLLSIYLFIYYWNYSLHDSHHFQANKKTDCHSWWYDSLSACELWLDQWSVSFSGFTLEASLYSKMKKKKVFNAECMAQILLVSENSVAGHKT